ncbi:MAG: hypothetical protein MUE73_00185, partial [Planctomycetes bacterium]|nr:hypothetical protein [Planctomycetota bacterium]
SVGSGRWRRRLVAGAAVAVVCLLAIPAWREFRRSDEDRVRAAAEELLAALLEHDWQGFADLLDPDCLGNAEDLLADLRAGLPAIPADWAEAGVTAEGVRKGDAAWLIGKSFESFWPEGHFPKRVVRLTLARQGARFEARADLDAGKAIAFTFDRRGWRALGRWRCTESFWFMGTMKFHSLERKLPVFLPVGAIDPASVHAVLTVGSGGVSGDERAWLLGRLNAALERAPDPATAVLDASGNLTFAAVIDLHDLLMRAGFDRVLFTAAEGEPPAGLWLNGEPFTGPDGPPPGLRPSDVLDRVLRAGGPPR